MTDKFRNKFRIASARLADWDYGQNAAYFITICTVNMEHYFGEITGGRMKLSPLGFLAEALWKAIPNQFPFTLLDEFIVMPNHLHGIVIIDKHPDSRDAIHRVSDEDATTGDAAGEDTTTRDTTTRDTTTRDATTRDATTRDATTRDTTTRDTTTRDAINRVSTRVVDDGGQFHKGGITGAHNPMLYDNLSRIIRWYKGRVSFEAKQISSGFAWQPRFHDHVIRDAAEFERIRKYIFSNPENWGQDEFHS